MAIIFIVFVTIVLASMFPEVKAWVIRRLIWVTKIILTTVLLTVTVATLSAMKVPAFEVINGLAVWTMYPLIAVMLVTLLSKKPYT